MIALKIGVVALVVLLIVWLFRKMVKSAESCPPQIEDCEFDCRRTDCTGCPKITPRLITLVVAPGIPSAEVKALREHVRMARKDPDYKIITNYEFGIDFVEIPVGCNAVVQAPGLPGENEDLLPEGFVKREIEALRDQVNDPENLVVVNYECAIEAVPIAAAVEGAKLVEPSMTLGADAVTPESGATPSA